MTYRILDPTSPDPSFIGLCALAVMAKAPRAGKVKTRLSPPLTLQQAAALNTCFLQDTTANLVSVAGALGLICYTPAGDESAFDSLLPAGFSLVPQRGEAFGERLQAATEDILACGFASVCLIDSDSPTVPRAAFEQAVAALRKPGDRVVLGPSKDGGYYLIGLKQSHPELFENIAWSTESVTTETRKRCETAGLELIDLPLWYDVDDEETLRLLQTELLEGKPLSFASPEITGYAADSTREFLLSLRSLFGMPLSIQNQALTPR